MSNATLNFVHPSCLNMRRLSGVIVSVWHYKANHTAARFQYVLRCPSAHHSTASETKRGEAVTSVMELSYEKAWLYVSPKTAAEAAHENEPRLAALLSR